MINLKDFYEVKEEGGLTKDCTFYNPTTNQSFKIRVELENDDSSPKYKLFDKSLINRNVEVIYDRAVGNIREGDKVIINSSKQEKIVDKISILYLHFYGNINYLNFTDGTGLAASKCSLVGKTETPTDISLEVNRMLKDPMYDTQNTK